MIKWNMIEKSKSRGNRIADNTVSITTTAIQVADNLKFYLSKKFVEIYISSNLDFLGLKPTDNIMTGYGIVEKTRLLNKSKNPQWLVIPKGRYHAEWNEDENRLIVDLRENLK